MVLQSYCELGFIFYRIILYPVGPVGRMLLDPIVVLLLCFSYAQISNAVPYKLMKYLNSLCVYHN